MILASLTQSVARPYKIEPRPPRGKREHSACGRQLHPAPECQPVLPASLPSGFLICVTRSQDCVRLFLAENLFLFVYLLLVLFLWASLDIEVRLLMLTRGCAGSPIRAGLRSCGLRPPGLPTVPPVWTDTSCPASHSRPAWTWFPSLI